MYFCKSVRTWITLFLSYRPARLHRLTESITGLLKRLQIRAQDADSKLVFGKLKWVGLIRTIQAFCWPIPTDSDWIAIACGSLWIYSNCFFVYSIFFPASSAPDICRFTPLFLVRNEFRRLKKDTKSDLVWMGWDAAHQTTESLAPTSVGKVRPRLCSGQHILIFPLF